MVGRTKLLQRFAIIILRRQGKALAVLSGVALVYACFGMAASAIHAKITARALPCTP